MADYKPKPLTCAGKTSDDHSAEEKQTNVGVDGLASTALSLIHQATQKALKQQKEFTDQDCGAKCDKVQPVDAPAPTLDKLNFSHVQGKVDVFNLTVEMKWKATVECKLKPEVLKEINVQVAGATAHDTIATIKYECIEGVIWVLIFSGDGKVELGRFRTEQKCPLPKDKTIDEYTYSQECVEGYWWVLLTDPKTKRVILQVKTAATCKEEKEKDKDKGR